MKIFIACFLFPFACLAQEKLSFKTNDNRDYKNVTISSSNAAEISVVTDSGIDHVPLSVLPPDLQQKFGYDPAKAGAQQQAISAAKAEFSKRYEQQREKEADEGKMGQVRADMAKLAISVKIKIVQVLSDGVIADGEYFQSTGAEINDEFGKRPAGSWEDLGTIFVATDTQKYSDGDELNGQIYPAGRYIYEATSGARATIRRYATDADEASRLMAKEMAAGQQ